MERGIIIYYFAGSSLMLLLVIAIVIYILMHEKKVVRLRQQLHEEDLHRQQAIFDALQEGQEKERTRLAQELHDGVGAKLSGLKMNLEYLKLNVNEHTDLVSKVYTGVSEALEEVREVSHNLMPYVFSGKGMEQLLWHCIEQFNALDGCRYSLLISTPVSEMDETIKMHVYRIVAELLNNIHKHARASIASVQVHEEEGKLEIVVEDNGIGMQEARSNAEGIGLKNIGNRVNICKGLLNMDSSGKGTTVMIEIPLNTNV